MFGRFAVALAFALCTCGLHNSVQTDQTDQTTYQLVISDQVADNLALLYDRFSDSEFLLCLEGKVEGTIVQVEDFRMPHIDYSRRTTVRATDGGGCGQYEDILGTIHNHPRGITGSAGCYLSGGDIKQWLNYETLDFSFIICAPYKIAYWHRSQVQPTLTVIGAHTGQLWARDAETASKILRR